jgi:hypothetical protein
MKLKIEREFKDKFTGKKYTAGSEVEFEDERAKELLADPRDLVTQVKEASEDKPKEVPKKSTRKSKK